jgi:enoyl-CoA hydratase
MSQQEYAGGSILLEVQDGIGTITIDRPHRRNALDNEAAAGLGQALRDADEDSSIGALLLTGAQGHFCAGADLKALADGPMYVPWAGDPAGPCHRQMNKPLIAAVEGYACAGGLGVALRCDLRVAGEGAVFAVLSRRWGVPMSDGTTVRLPRLIGQGRALDMLMTGRPVGAEEASRIGLADRMVSTGAALQTAQELARQLLAFPQAALLADRASVYAGLDLPLAEALAKETEISIRARDKDAQVGAGEFASGKGRHGKPAG